MSIAAVVLQERLALLDSLELLTGAHADNNGKCALEAVAWLAGEKHSDHPACVSPVLGDFCRNWNDCLDDATRQRLKPFLPRLIGTAGNAALDLRRSWMAFDWLTRECGPAFMDLTPSLASHASAIRALPEIVDKATLDASIKARAAARARAGAGAGAWAWAAAAAGAAAGAGAWAAAAAGDAAAAGAAAGAGAGAWAWAAAAAGDAAGRTLAPVVAQLQDSAFALLDRMIEVRL